MTDVLPAPDLEAAIRAGVERGLDAAPVVPDLAERVLALPPARRPLPVLAVAASVVAVLVAVGLMATSPWSSGGAPAASPQPSKSASVHPTSGAPTPPPGPPYATPGPAPTGSELRGAVGIWIPVWFAGYDGLSPARLNPLPRLQIRLNEGGPARASRYELTPRTTSCQVIPVALTSTSGHVIGSEPGPRRPCTSESPSAERAFATAIGSLGDVGIGKDGALTFYQRGIATAQFIKQGHGLPRQASNGSLPGDTNGSWSRLGLPDGMAAGLPTIALGGVTLLTLNPDGSYTGSTNCATVSGTFSVQADARARFSVPHVSAHPCPAQVRTPGSLADARQVARYGHFLDLLDGHGHVLGVFEETAAFEVEGTWTMRAPYATLSFTDGVIHGYACGIAYWTYTIDTSGRFSARVHAGHDKCVGPIDPGGLVTALKEAANVTLDARGHLQLVSSQGTVLASLTRAVPG